MPSGLASPRRVEVVADFVANDCADATVVGGDICTQIKEGRLQDRSRKDDLIGKWVVIGINGLRRHMPFVAVDGCANLGDGIGMIKFSDTPEVAN